MTFEELDKELPNGFHDGELHSVKIDYVGGSAALRMACDFGNPERSKREDYRMGELRVSGLYFFAIDPPDPPYRYVPNGRALNISGDQAKPDTFPAIEELSRTLPPASEKYSGFHGRR